MFDFFKEMYWEISEKQPEPKKEKNYVIFSDKSKYLILGIAIFYGAVAIEGISGAFREQQIWSIILYILSGFFAIGTVVFAFLKRSLRNEIIELILAILFVVTFYFN